MTDDTGRIVTIDGPIDPDELGVTLPHEHVFIDAVEAWYDPPASAPERAIARRPVSLETLWYVLQNPEYVEDNLRLDSEAEAIDELARYHRAGGDAIVDVTPKNLGGHPTKVRGIARETGLTLVHGTGYYTRAAHPPEIDDRSVDDLEDEFVTDVRDGIDDTDIRAGLIGEMGVSGHIHDQEETVLRAAARAAIRTGAPLMIHPPGRTPYAQRDRTYPSSRWALDLLDIVEAEGLPADRVVMCHMDRTLFEDISYQLELAARGPFLEFDVWGLECYIQQYADGYPSDHWRTDTVLELIGAGYTDQLLFSQDVHMKIQRVAYGGFGYEHILRNVVPRLRSRGMSREEINTILVENPQRFLTFDEPA